MYIFESVFWEGVVVVAAVAEDIVDNMVRDDVGVEEGVDVVVVVVVDGGMVHNCVGDVVDMLADVHIEEVLHEGGHNGHHWRIHHPPLLSRVDDD